MDSAVSMVLQVTKKMVSMELQAIKKMISMELMCLPTNALHGNYGFLRNYFINRPRWYISWSRVKIVVKENALMSTF